jgi:kynurenine formamidase
MSSVLSLHHEGQLLRVDLADAVDLSLLLDPAAPGPGFFGADDPRVEVLRAGEWIGSTAAGGGCNVRVWRVNPHCNGTHTESASHVVDALLPPTTLAVPLLLPALFVRVLAARADASDDARHPVGEPDDRVIDAAALTRALAPHERPWRPPALVVQTQPDAEQARTRRYDGPSPHPYFTREAMQLLRRRGVEHLLVDTPSLDRAHDGGHMIAHRTFWELPPTGHAPPPAHARARTVSEFVVAPATLAEGHGLLNLQLAAWANDAVPSRPVFMPLLQAP